MAAAVSTAASAITPISRFLIWCFTFVAGRDRVSNVRLAFHVPLLTVHERTSPTVIRDSFTICSFIVHASACR